MNSPITGSSKIRLGRLLNAAIIVMFLVVAGIVSKGSFSPPPEPPVLAPTARIFVEGIDWATSEQTLLVAVRKGCAYCSRSGRFYRKLADGLKGRADARMVVVYPDETSQGEAYLREIGLTLIESKREKLAPLGIKLVPTLALVDRNGIVSKVWVGELSPKKESEVMAALQFKDTRAVSEWTISESDLKRRIANREAIIILDLRDREAYINGHMDKAKNIPWDEVYARAKNELPQNQIIVLYSNDEIQADIAYSDLFRLGYTNVLVYTG
ncbi:MAG TPA: rhodanese-like domain-containing protein [Pyrinomonadaceae bacterium]|nr:rhodanese-like domain-containing protein [Pyrinomonadaceae bacterium]